MNLFNLLTEIINKKHLLSQLVNMGYDDESAQTELDDLMNWVNNLGDTIILYRILVTDDKKNINLKKPGSHYSMNKKDLIKSHSYLTGSGEKYFLLTVKSPKKLIDVNETINNNILYPNEQEITLKNKGLGSEVIDITQIK